jgi:hypothetical protein
MSLTRSLLAVAIAVLLVVAASGCGDANGDTAEKAADSSAGTGGGGATGEADQVEPPSQLYGKVLRGLRDAAGSNTTYNALRRAKGLPASEEAAIVGFCETAWQIDVNEETSKLSIRPYIRGRVRARTAINLQGPYGAEAKAALVELGKVIDLASLDARLNRRYKKACYR